MGACMRCVAWAPRERLSESGSGASGSQREESPQNHRKSKMGQSHPKHRALSRMEIRSLQRQVSFREAEIQDWYDEFCYSIQHRSQPGEFCLTHEEFVKIYNSVFPGQCTEFAGHIFRTFDQNGDNRVDFREFLIGMSCSGSDNIEKQLTWAFQVYDVRRTGYITLEDMTQIVQAVFKMIGRSVWSDGISPESMAKDLFSQMDVDQDHRVSLHEFRQGVLRNPAALQILQCSPPGEPTPQQDSAVYS